MKYVIVIGDGMADDPVTALGGKTPLEVAEKPGMDALAAAGELGSVLTVPKGVPPGSDTAILSIFGYDPRRFYSGRSPLEAAGCGVALAGGDVSYRCNMVALEDGKPFAERKILSHSGGSVDGDASMALLAALLADERFAASARKNGVVFHASPSFRHIAVQKGASITGLVADPPHDYLGEPAGEHLPRGCAAATGLREMMELANEVLDHHPINEKRRAEGKLPANGIWFWAEGTAIELPAFERRFGKTGFVVSAVPLVRGIGALAGLRYVEVEGATGELDTNYEGKAAAALAGLLVGGADFALVHVEAPDECTHNGDTPGKIEAIRRLDARCLARLRAGLDESGEPWRMLVLSDHKTLTATRTHGGDPVPYLLYDSSYENRDGSQGPQGSGLAYTEENAAKGPYIGEGHTLIARLLEAE